ncbi:hypothetical protein LTR85_005391 [Meristemomyces frigidus]|nr:hypothetical protein LTR85_005391 [Meristemomyces frigidus]
MAASKSEYFKDGDRVKRKLEVSIAGGNGPAIELVLRKWHRSLNETGAVPNYLIHLLDVQDCQQPERALMLEDMEEADKRSWDAVYAAAGHTDFACYLCHVMKERSGNCFTGDGSKGLDENGNFHVIEDVTEESVELLQVASPNGTPLLTNVMLDERHDLAHTASIESSWDPDEEEYTEANGSADDFMKQALPNSSSGKRTTYRFNLSLQRLQTGCLDIESSFILAKLCVRVMEVATRKKQALPSRTAFPDTTLWLTVTASISVDHADLAKEAIGMLKRVPAEGPKDIARAASKHKTHHMRPCWDALLARCGKAEDRLPMVKTISTEYTAPSPVAAEVFDQWKASRLEVLAMEFTRDAKPSAIVEVLCESACASSLVKVLLPHLEAPLRNHKLIPSFGKYLHDAVRHGRLDRDLAATVFREVVTPKISKSMLPTNAINTWSKLAPGDRKWAASVPEYKNALAWIEYSSKLLADLHPTLLDLGMTAELDDQLVDVLKSRQSPLDGPENRQLFIYVLSQFSVRFVKPEPPSPRGQYPKLGCGCPDCCSLDKFLLDKDRGRLLELKQETLTNGSPHTLQITKTNGEYEYRRWTKRFEHARELINTSIAPAEDLRQLLGDAFENVTELKNVKRASTGRGGLVDTLLNLAEPERTLRWLKMCFEADATSETPQTVLWDEYQGTFGAFRSTHGLLPETAFMANIKAAFPNAVLSPSTDLHVVRGVKARQSPSCTEGWPTILTPSESNENRPVPGPAPASSPFASTSHVNSTRSTTQAVFSAEISDSMFSQSPQTADLELQALTPTEISSLRAVPESHRISAWLRMCFVDSPGTESSQIDMWKTYCEVLGPSAAQHLTVKAGALLVFVSQAFPSVTFAFGTTGLGGGVADFRIRGIRARGKTAGTPAAAAATALARAPLAPIASSALNAAANRMAPPGTPASGKRKNDGLDAGERPSKRAFSVIDLSDSPSP